MSTSTSIDVKSARGYTIALVSAVVFSTTAIFIRYLTQIYDMPPLVLAFWRDGFVVMTLLPVLGMFRSRLLWAGRRHVFYLVAYGFVLAVYNALWTFSVAMNGAAVATVLVYCSAAFTALLGRWLLDEHLGWIKGLAILLSLAGCVLVSEMLDTMVWDSGLFSKLPGFLVGMLSGLCYAVYSLMGRVAAQRGLNPWTTLLYTFCFATLFLLLVNLFPVGLLPGTGGGMRGLFGLGHAMTGWGVLFLLAAGPTLIGYGLYNVSLSYLSSGVVNLLVTSEPAFTAVIAYLVLDERFSMIQLGGSLMILAGVALTRVDKG
jgi:drug/metabolite transporter (DMT)-like permease